MNRQRHIGQLLVTSTNHDEDVTMNDAGDLELLRREAPQVPAASDHSRARAHADLMRAVRAETDERRPAASRRLWRLAPAAGVTTLVVATVIGAIGPSSSDDGPSVLGPSSAAAVVEAVAGEGYTEIRFLDPTADPARVHAELGQLGIDLEVTFVPADPFTVGRLVFSQGAEGIELLGETGSELEGGAIGIRVSEDWSGTGSMTIGRSAEDGEVFETSLPLNADRPGGPLHCTPVRGLSPTEATEVVTGAGLRVEWRTSMDGRATAEQPPADFVVHDALWHQADTVLLFAEAGSDVRPLPESVTADCEDR